MKGDHPFFGPKPKVGDIVYIDFGDSIQSHPEITGKVVFVSDEHITVGEKRFRIDECVHIEVV